MSAGRAAAGIVARVRALPAGSATSNCGLCPRVEGHPVVGTRGCVVGLLLTEAVALLFGDLLHAESACVLHGGLELAPVHLLPLPPQLSVVLRAPPSGPEGGGVGRGAPEVPPAEALGALEVGLLHEAELHRLQQHAQDVLHPELIQLPLVDEALKGRGPLQARSKQSARRRSRCGRLTRLGRRCVHRQDVHVGPNDQEGKVHHEDAHDRRPLPGLHDVHPVVEHRILL
mmetsp:Transcript_93317/g.278624  ORF Transcript_93317/g.278624 Transcript_93317/m.278624 type:complete len:229 (+) Transcript_93317:222-908(+)